MKRTIITLSIVYLSVITLFAQTPGRYNMPSIPVGDNFDTKEVYIPSGQDSIYTVICIPKGDDEKKPVLIMSHGYGSNSMVFYEQMADICKARFITVAFDFCGGARMGKSSGLGKNMSVLSEKNNLLDVIEYISCINKVDTDNIILLGESQGGFVSAFTASEIPDKIKALVLIYPAFCIQDDARALYKSLNEVPEEVTFMNFDIGKKYYEDIYNYDIYKDLSKFKKNVLLIHGDQDAIVNIDYARKAVPHYKSIEFYTIKGAGHGFRGADKVKSDSLTKAFILKEVK